MENTRIKYLVMTSIEEELDTLGVYDSKEEAFNAMQSDFCKAVGVDEKNIDEWLDETDDAAICPMDARALDCTTEDGQNHDWRIIPLVCDGECRVAEEHDYLVVSGIYNTECDSGAVFSSPCRVDTSTGKVSHIGMAGQLADDDSVRCTSVTIADGEESKEYAVCDVQEILDENSTEEALETLEAVLKAKAFWVYKAGSLTDAIEECKKQLASEVQ